LEEIDRSLDRRLRPRQDSLPHEDREDGPTDA